MQTTNFILLLVGVVSVAASELAEISARRHERARQATATCDAQH
jgi:hypothetical protein